MRLGLIGAGRWGRVIIRSFQDVSGARLVRLATRNPLRPPGLPGDCVVTPDAGAVATADDIDGVVIATPASLHAELAMRALRAGNAVFVEKPMTHTVESGQALLDLAQCCRGILRVDHIDLHNPAWKGLKAHLGEIGDVVAVELAFGGGGPSRDDVPPRWDWGAHPLALLYDLFGPPISVHARHLVVRGTPAGLVERVRIDVESAGGAPATITTGNAFAGRRRTVTVRGRTATLVYDDNAPTKLTKVVDRVAQPLSEPVGTALTCSLEAFIDSVRRGAPDWQDAVLGLSVVSTLTAVDRCLE